jgi:hypothetical protein
MLVVEITAATRRRVVKHLHPHLGDEFPTLSFVLDADELLGYRNCTGQHWRLESFRVHPEFPDMISSSIIIINVD